MKDKELRIYEILYGGICMMPSHFFCPESFLSGGFSCPCGGFLSLWRRPCGEKVFFSIFCSGQLLEWLVLRRAGISSRRPA